MRSLGEHRGLGAAGAHAGVDEGERFVGGEGVDGDGDGDGTGERFEHRQPELAGEIFGAAQDDGEGVERIDAELVNNRISDRISVLRRCASSISSTGWTWAELLRFRTCSLMSRNMAARR